MIKAKRERSHKRPFKGPGSAYIAGQLGVTEWISDGKQKILRFANSAIEGWIYKCIQGEKKWNGFDSVDAGKWIKLYDFDTWQTAYEWYMKGIRE